MDLTAGWVVVTDDGAKNGAVTFFFLLPYVFSFSSRYRFRYTLGRVYNHGFPE